MLFNQRHRNAPSEIPALCLRYPVGKPQPSSHVHRIVKPQYAIGLQNAIHTIWHGEGPLPGVVHIKGRIGDDDQTGDLDGVRQRRHGFLSLLAQPRRNLETNTYQQSGRTDQAHEIIALGNSNRFLDARAVSAIDVNGRRSSTAISWYDPTHACVRVDCVGAQVIAKEHRVVRLLPVQCCTYLCIPARKGDAPHKARLITASRAFGVVEDDTKHGICEVVDIERLTEPKTFFYLRRWVEYVESHVH